MIRWMYQSNLLVALKNIDSVTSLGPFKVSVTGKPGFIFGFSVNEDLYLGSIIYDYGSIYGMWQIGTRAKAATSGSKIGPPLDKA